jgi:hypothetical protein
MACTETDPTTRNDDGATAPAALPAATAPPQGQLAAATPTTGTASDW